MMSKLYSPAILATLNIIVGRIEKSKKIGSKI